VTLASTTVVALWFDRLRGVPIGVSSAIGGGLMSLAPIVLGGRRGCGGGRALEAAAFPRYFGLANVGRSGDW
jgi:hypothetical protein